MRHEYIERKLKNWLADSCAQPSRAQPSEVKKPQVPSYRSTIRPITSAEIKACAYNGC
jgi:hypothetical protein